MNITLSLGDFLSIGAIVVLFTRPWRLGDGGDTPQTLRARRQLDAIMRHLGLPEPMVSRPGALSPEVLALLAGGRKIDAIRLYRQETGAGLKQARDAVEVAGPG